MACLVAPGAFRVAVAISVARPPEVTTASTGSSLGSISTEGSNRHRPVGGGMFFKSSVPKTATNAAEAAAAAAALAALATGSLSLGVEGDTRAPINSDGSGMLTRKRQCVLAALGASLGPHATAKRPCHPFGLPGRHCPAAANARWIRDCIVGRLQQHHSLALATAVTSSSLPPISPTFGLLPGATYRALAAGIENVRDGARERLENLLRGAIAIFREGEEKACCTLRAVNAWKQVGPWSPLGTTWRSRLNSKGLIMRRIDAGGGGDCLFHSVALSLAGRGFPIDSLELRRIAADKAAGLRACEKGAVMAPKEEELFLERLGVMAALELAGEWQDGWSPASIVAGRKAYVATTGYVFDTSTVLGKAQAVHYEMRRPGNNHWGTASDICALEEALDLGIIVMDDSTGKIYPTACERKRRSHYIFLYFIGGCHFQLVGLETSEGHQTVFAPDELPVGLLRLFQEDTKNDLVPLPSVKKGTVSPQTSEISVSSTVAADGG